MAHLTLALFGPYSVIVNDQLINRFRTNRVQALLAYLAVEQSRDLGGHPVHRRDALTDLLWPGMPTSSALQNLRQTLYELKKVVPDYEPDETPFLLTNRQTIQINPDYPISVDTTRFIQLLAHHPDHWQEAVDLYRGDFLADFQLPDAATFELWAAERRSDYRRQVLDALTSLVDMQIERQAFGEAERLARRQLAIDPLREKAYQQLMKALALDGKRAEALRHYDICKQQLDEQLAVPVSQEMEKLALTIRAEKLPTFGRTQTQLGGYDLKEMIGSGNFGSVYRGIQTSIGREVAVKIIRDKYANDPDFIRQFEVEAQTIARLEHPHIVPLYDFWREPGSAYLVMRWLRGGSLADQLNGGWPLEKALPLIYQIGHGLNMAHEQGIIHRDIKPANILLDERGNGYLSDFGIASSDNPFTSREHSEQFTPAEMLLSATSISPEQVNGQALSIASDIYSFGVLLYQLLTGAHPFQAESPVHLAQLHATEAIPSLSALRPSLPANLDGVIQKATAKQPQHRFATIIELIQSFKNVVDEEGGFLTERYPIVSQMPSSGKNPYKGLQAFGESDAELFFGREQLINQLAEKIKQDRFLAIVGPSGSGKSSVVKAGLLPALRQTEETKRWFITQMLPSTHPFEELETALLRIAIEEPPSLLGQLEDGARGLIRALKRIIPAGNDSTVLLVIDQFEELFTLVEDEAVRHAFIDTLVTAVQKSNSPLRVVLTLRADFYDRPLLVDGLSTLMQAHTEAITPLTAAELSEAIVQPAAQVGVTVEPALVTTMVTDVKEQPGGLPLLQYALTELYEARGSDTLTLNSYHEIGGVLGALAKRAESLYQAFTPAEQSLVRQLFLRLITLGEGVEDTRRRALQSELAGLEPADATLIGLDSEASGSSALQTILDTFGKARLLSYDRDPSTRSSTVEVAHEALLREWPRLRSWLDGSRDDVRLQRLLGQAAGEWEAADRDSGFLLTGTRLKRYAGWVEAAPVSLTETERAFLAASEQEQLAQAAAEAKRQQRELEAAQQLAETERQRAEEQEARAQEQELAAGRLRQRAFWLAGAFGLALVLAGIAFVFGQRATAQQVIAETNAEAAATSEADAVANAELAAENERKAQAQADLSFARELAVQANLALENDPELSLILAKESLDIVHTQEAETALHLGMQNSFVRKSYNRGYEFGTLSPNGKYLFLGRQDSQVFGIYEPNTLELLFEGEGHFQFWLDNNHVYVSLEPFGDEIVENAVYNLNLQAIVDYPIAERYTWISDGSSIADYDEKNRIMASSLVSGEILFWDLKIGKQITIVKTHTDPISGLSFNSDGSLLASSDFSNQIYLWDTSLLSTQGKIELIDNFTAFDGNHSGGVGFEFNSDSSKLFIFGGQGIGAELREISDLKTASTRYKGVSNRIQALILNKDESLLFAPDSDGQILIWDVQSGEPKKTLLGHTGVARLVGLTENESKLISIGIDSTIRVWDLGDLKGSETVEFEPAPFGTGIDVSPNGEYVAVAMVDGPTHIYSRKSGQIVKKLGGGDKPSLNLAFSPNGSEITVVGNDDYIRTWDVESGELLLEFDGHDSTTFGFFSGIFAVDYSPDGATIATGSSDGLVKLWDAESGNLVRTFTDYPGKINFVRISSDGSYIIASGQDQNNILAEIRVWDLETGEYLRTVGGITNQTWGVAVHPTKPIVLAGGWAGDVKAWNFETGEELFAITSLGGGVIFRTSFSPDGDYFVISGSGDPAQLYKTETGELVAILTNYPFGGLEFTPDNTIVSNDFSPEGAVREITVFLEDALALAEERITRELTEQECLQYLRRADCGAGTDEG